MDIHSELCVYVLHIKMLKRRFCLLFKQTFIGLFASVMLLKGSWVKAMTPFHAQTIEKGLMCKNAEYNLFLAFPSHGSVLVNQPAELENSKPHTTKVPEN